MLAWITFGIEYHHIHHLNSRVPSYNLQKCHDEGMKKGLFKHVPTFTLKQALPFRNFGIYNELEEVFENAYSYLPSENAKNACKVYDLIRAEN